MGIPKGLSKFEKAYILRVGHASRNGATKEELDVLKKANDIFQKYPLTKQQEENLNKI